MRNKNDNSFHRRKAGDRDQWTISQAGALRQWELRQACDILAMLPPHKRSGNQKSQLRRNMKLERFQSPPDNE
jgi:hypothetical protein